MLKVLIADDEKNICLMIQKLVPWEELGMEVIGLVHNGIDAVSRMEEERPDIVISDIRMPGYDGLEIVRKAKEMSLSADFVIISGYKYFEYAHTALNLGVEHYLLKPIDKKELNETLEKIQRKRAADNQKAEKEEGLKEQARYSRQKIQKHFLSSIMEKGVRLKDMELNSINAEFQCEFEQGCFAAVFAKVDCEEKGQDLTGLLNILEEIIEKDLKDSSKEYINSVMKSGIISIINYKTEIREDTLLGIEKPLLKMRRELDKFQGFHITMGVGGEKNSISEIAESIHEAVCAVKCRGKAGLDRVIFYEKLRYHELSVEEILNPNRGEIEKITETLDYDALYGVFANVREQILKDVFYSPVTIYGFLEQTTENILSILRKNQAGDELLEKTADEVQQVLDFYTDTEEMVYRVIEIIRNCFEQVIAEKKNRSQLPIRMARQYVQEHYKGQVSLEDAAQAIGLSSAYLSTMFKKELGINFSDYLISCRMEAAKELLKQTDLPIAEVAGQVGYTDSRYFSKTFNKVVGLKPSVYRKLYW